MKRAKRIGCLLMALCILCSGLVYATEIQSAVRQTSPAESADTLEAVVQQLQDTYNLDERNFSLCYYNTVTKESYSFNPDAWMVATSTYKLPLNMYYYEQEAAGAIAPDAVIAGHSLEKIHYESIVNSNNELSEALIYNLGSFRHYKELLFDSYGELAPEELPDIVWHKNYFSTRYMLNTLKYLYANADTFDQLLEYMRQAVPNAYFKKYVTQYEIAHKYGSYNSAENDVGIIFTKEPYLLAVYTYGLPNGEDVVGRVNEAVCNYNVAHLQPDIPPQVTEVVLPTTADIFPETAQFAEPATDKTPAAAFLARLLAYSGKSPALLLGIGAAILGLLIFFICWTIHRRRKEKRASTEV